MNIFFDLDGTLIDSKQRLYKLFQHLVPQSTLGFDDYWEFKQNKFNHAYILTNKFGYTLTTIEIFERSWMEKIELEEWLTLDRPFDGIDVFLKQLSKRHNLYIVTARQFEDKALQQIESFGWKTIFKDVFVTQQKKEKFELINNVVKVTSDDWFVGDTGKDIQTGKLLGVKTAAVLSGFMNEDKLSQYGPDRISNNVLELKFT